jgi:hypothetical protein
MDIPQTWDVVVETSDIKTEILHTKDGQTGYPIMEYG